MRPIRIAVLALTLAAVGGMFVGQMEAHAADASADIQLSGRPTPSDVNSIEVPATPLAPPIVVPNAPQLDDLAEAGLGAVRQRQWAVLASIILVAFLSLSRRLGGHFVPWFNTPRGGKIVGAGLGTAVAWMTALQAGLTGLQAIAFAVSMSAGASGVHSWFTKSKPHTPT